MKWRSATVPFSRVLFRVCLLGVSMLVALGVAALLFGVIYNGRFEARVRAAATEHAVSADTFNIYYFGESTMAGEPYAPQASIPRIIDHLVGGVVAGKPIRSVNLAQPGSDIAFTLERLKDVVANRDTTHPSLCVFYVGHNEFLKYQGRVPHALLGLPTGYLTLFQRVDALFPVLEIDDRKLFDVGVADHAERQAVVAEYKSRVLEAVALLKQSGIPAVISTVAGNYADWEPNRTEFVGSDEDAKQVERLLERGAAFEQSNDDERALFDYETALTRYGSMAEVHFRAATIYRRLGRYEEAWGAFQQAVDSDAMPIRATSAINEFLLTLNDGPIAVVDAVAHLRKSATNGLIGSDLMIDGHHPTLAGYARISELIASRIPDAAAVKPLTELEAQNALGIDRAKQFEIAVSRGRWHTKLATWRYEPDARLRKAEAFFQEALQYAPSRQEPYVGLAMVALLRRDAPSAERHIRTAREFDAAAVDDYFREHWVRLVRDRAYNMDRPRAGRAAARKLNSD